MNWKYTDETRQFVYKEGHDGSKEICNPSREDVQEWVVQGGVIEEPDSEQPEA